VSGISWAICKSAPLSRHITMPAPHHSSFLQAGCPSCRLTVHLRQVHTDAGSRLEGSTSVDCWASTFAWKQTDKNLSISRPHLLIISLLLPLLGLCGRGWLYKTGLDKQYTGPKCEVSFTWYAELIGTGGLPVCMWCYEIVMHVWHVDASIEDSLSPSKLFVSLSFAEIWNVSLRPKPET